MSINPDNITTIRVDQLAEATLNLTNEFPHSEDATLRKATIQSLVDLVATAVGSGSGVGFLPISVTDGQQLPDVPTDPSFFLCGPGTYLNINGYPNVVCTDELNAVMSLTDHWQLSVGIPITADLQSIGISQSVNDGVLDKAPSENAVYNFISQWLPKASLGYFDYADLATQTTPITVVANTQTLLTNDTLGDDTNTSQPPYGVTSIWDADSDEFNFQQLSIGDTVDIRVHLKTTTTTANQKYHVDMKFAFDGPSEFENRIFSQYVKTSGEDEQTFITTLYIGSEDVKNYPARLYITSDDDATVKVVGWFCRVFRKSVNIVDLITDEAPIDGLTYGRKDAGWVEVSGGGGGATNLGYTASPTNGIVTSSTGTDATLPLATGTNAGLLKPAKFTLLESTTEAFTTALKTAYDSAVTWISTNGTNLINHLSNTSNPHSTTASQVGAIPLDGTGVGAPITGDLSYDVLDGVARKITYEDANGDNVDLAFGNDGTELGALIKAIGFYGTDGTSFGKLGLDQNFNPINEVGNGTYASQAYFDSVLRYFIYSDNPSFKGVEFSSDFSANITDYCVAQKIYVDTKLKQTEARTGAVIAFDDLAVYNSFSSPTASNITNDLTGAKIGIVQKIYSNKATEPTYPAGWVKLSGTYTNSVTNIIYAEWCEGSRVEYWIVEA
jgi:hypothetical protein